jgi:hypothetical protein
MTRPHHHPIHDQRGLASIEHEHPGADVQHVHEGQPELGPSTSQDVMMAAMERAAARAGVSLTVPK